MKRTKYIFSKLYLLIAMIIFIVSIVVNQSYFKKISNESIVLYQMKQVFCILVFFLIGFYFLRSMYKTTKLEWKYLLAFPIGLCIYGIAGILLLLLKVPYSNITVGGTLVLLLFVTIFWCIKKQIKSEDKKKELALLYIVFGTILLASTGWVYIIQSYDTLYYFINYGNALTQIGSWKEIAGNNSFALTNIGQFLPIISSVSSCWGLDQNFQLQTFFTLNVIFIYFWMSFEILKKNLLRKQAVIGALIATSILITTTGYIFTTSWGIANMYCMSYLFLIYILIILFREKQIKDIEFVTVSGLFVTALTLLRKDGFIFSCFIVLCISVVIELKKKQLFTIFIPGIILNSWYIAYVRLELEAETQIGASTSIANNKNIIMLVACIILTTAYLLVQDKLPIIWKEHEYEFIIAGLIVGNILLFLLLPGRTIDNVDTTIKNIFRLPSSSGISAGFITIFLCFMRSCRKKERMKYDEFFICGYCLLTFGAYNVAKDFWVNIDDSFLRVLLQITPILIWGISMTLVPKLFAERGNKKNV